MDPVAAAEGDAAELLDWSEHHPAATYTWSCTRRTFPLDRRHLISVTAFGLLNPILAGAAVAFSSVSGVTNGLRLYRFGGLEPQPRGPSSLR